MGSWEYLGISEYPDLETAFRVLGLLLDGPDSP